MFKVVIIVVSQVKDEIRKGGWERVEPISERDL